MHNRNQTLKYITIAVVLIAVGTGAWGFHFFNDLRQNIPAIRVLTGMPDMTGTRPIRFKIGETTLNIPRNYFSIYLPSRAQYYGDDLKLHDGPDKNQINFGMHLLLPNYEPKTEQNKVKFEHGPFDDILVLVTSDSPQQAGDKKSLEAFYRFTHGNVTNGPYGYKQFQTLPSTYGMFQGTLDNPKNFALCSGIGTAPRPSCNRYITIAPKMTLQYTFPLQHLPEIPAMDSRLIDILNGFKVDGPSFSVMDEK